MIKKIDTGIKFVILIHPKEARKQRTGTGRLTALSLKDSELISGVDFTKQKKVNALIQNPEYFSVVLYPGEDALNAKSSSIRADHTQMVRLSLYENRIFMARADMQLGFPIKGHFLNKLIDRNYYFSYLFTDETGKLKSVCIDSLSNEK